MSIFSDYIDAVPEHFEIYRTFFSDNPSILDIGSCEGEEIIRFKRVFPLAKVFSFEPVKKNFSLLQKNVSDYNLSDVITHNLALSDFNGTSEIFVSSGTPNVEEKEWDYGNKSSSLLSPGEELKKLFPWLKFEGRETVIVARLDDIQSVSSQKYIDLIHIDVQGAEKQVIKGGMATFKKTGMVFIEVENVELYKNQALRFEVTKLLSKIGFLQVKEINYGSSSDLLLIQRKFLLKFMWNYLKGKLCFFTKKKLRPIS